MNSYILQKDLPDVKAGAIFEIGHSTDAFSAKQVKFFYLTSDKTGTKFNCYCYPKDFVENNPEWFKKEQDTATEKPPIGVKPQWLWKECRKQELVEAISRFMDAGKKIPTQWIDEINNLSS